MDSEVAQAIKNGDPVSVLVFLKDAANVGAVKGLGNKESMGRHVYALLTEHANRTQADLLHALSIESDVHVRRFHLVNAVLVENATSKLVHELAARKDVSRILLDKWVPFEFAEPTAEDLETTTNVSSIAGVGDNITSTNAPRVWSELGATGQGIVAAGQDTGYQWDHPAIKNQYRGYDGATGTADHRYSWHDAIRTGTGSNPCGFNSMVPCDDHGHGTHTMGTVVGDDGGANKVGMAPGAKWIGCRNMNKGAGKPSTYLDCLEWFLAPYPQGGNPQTDGKPEMAPDVINNSWGCDGTEGCRGNEFVQALANLEAAGVMFVASAGNSGSGCGTINAQPASISDTTLSVGAHSHTNNKIASFSSRGPSSYDSKVGPDVTAPGVSIRSSTRGGGYGSMSGTSMAGPHVAGQVALLLSAVPSLRHKPRETFDLIMKSAKPTTSTQTCAGVAGTAHPNNTFGYGMIDAYAAIRLAQETPPSGPTE